MSMVRVRAGLRSDRWSGWPSRTTANIVRTARVTSQIATPVIAAASTVETICTAPIKRLLFGQSGRIIAHDAEVPRTGARRRDYYL
jgi:hypothetical protein